MLSVRTWQYMDECYSEIRCHHGVLDRTGHMIYHDQSQISGENLEQLMCAAQDALTHAWKAHRPPACSAYEAHVLTQEAP